MEMKGRKIPSKCLIIKTNKYNNNSMCFFSYVAML